ncbi:hypothetical protein OBV_18170 [Oscillibacter valericigenes Sjm18-20]|nr:hypothetical protein OBV_18170 [Oscillibacter valericigenes Sjm18-20]
MSVPWRDLLPATVEVCGVEYDILSDYRAILDICVALSDPELSGQDKALVALDIFYPGFANMLPEHYDEAVKRCFWFINCGDRQDARPAPKLVDWEQDFKYIVAPINRVTGKEIRAVNYMHWWTFIAAYYEIGDCTFAQIVRIRDKKAKGKPLDKSDAKWYRENRQLVDMKTQYTQKDDDVLDAWLGKKKTAPD